MNESLLKRIFVALTAASIALATDQASKWVILNVVMLPPRDIAITPFFSLTLGFNSGMSFGLFRDSLSEWPGLFTFSKILIATAFLLWAVRTSSWAERVGFSMIAGGALGNAFDRWRQGAVTDFLDFHIGDWRWPTFNLADTSIVLGVGLLLVDAIVQWRLARVEWSKSASR